MELTLDQALQKGIKAHTAGQVQEADRFYTAILKAQPKHPEANHNMGVLAVGVGKVKEALPFFKTALEGNPNTDQFWLSYIDALIKLDRLADAQAVLDQAKNKGAKGNGFDKLEQKLQRIEPIASIPPRVQDPPQDQQQSLINLYSQGQLEQALEQATILLQQFPKSSVLHNICGAVYKGLGQLDASVKAYRKAIDIKPDYADAYNNRGNALKDQGKLEEAIEAYKKALAIKPDYAEAYNNMGNALKEQGKLEASVGAYNKALAIKPDYAEAYNNMGNALKEQRKLEESVDAYNKALAIKPDYAECHKNLSFALLNNGRLSEGLDEYEWRWKTTEFLRSKRFFLQPLWDGKTSLQDKRVLVWCEQGVGDTIVWSSHLPLLVSQAGHCILECQEKLVPLLSRSFPNIEVKPVDVSRDTKRDDFDFHLPMASLCRHFITEITQNPKPDTFLIPDPVRIKFWKDCLSSLGSGPYVGISWKSSLMGTVRSKHFSSLSEWSSLLKVPNIDFINLQYADAADGLLQIQNEFGVKVHNFDDLDQYNDLDEVAALSAALDCVVSFGTSVPMITAGVGTLTKCAVLANGTSNNILGGPIGPLVDRFEKNKWQPWSNVLGLIAEDIAKL